MDVMHCPWPVVRLKKQKIEEKKREEEAAAAELASKLAEVLPLSLALSPPVPLRRICIDSLAFLSSPQVDEALRKAKEAEREQDSLQQKEEARLKQVQENREREEEMHREKKDRQEREKIQTLKHMEEGFIRLQIVTKESNNNNLALVWSGISREDNTASSY